MSGVNAASDSAPRAVCLLTTHRALVFAVALMAMRNCRSLREGSGPWRSAGGWKRFTAPRADRIGIFVLHGYLDVNWTGRQRRDRHPLSVLLQSFQLP